MSRKFIKSKRTFVKRSDIIYTLQIPHIPVSVSKEISNSTIFSFKYFWSKKYRFFTFLYSRKTFQDSQKFYSRKNTLVKFQVIKKFTFNRKNFCSQTIFLVGLFNFRRDCSYVHDNHLWATKNGGGVIMSSFNPYMEYKTLYELSQEYDYLSEHRRTNIWRFQSQRYPWFKKIRYYFWEPVRYPIKSKEFRNIAPNFNFLPYNPYQYVSQSHFNYTNWLSMVYNLFELHLAFKLGRRKFIDKFLFSESDTYLRNFFLFLSNNNLFFNFGSLLRTTLDDGKSASFLFEASYPFDYFTEMGRYAYSFKDYYTHFKFTGKHGVPLYPATAFQCDSFVSLTSRKFVSFYFFYCTRHFSDAYWRALTQKYILLFEWIKRFRKKKKSKLEMRRRLKIKKGLRVHPRFEFLKLTNIPFDWYWAKAESTLDLTMFLTREFYSSMSHFFKLSADNGILRRDFLLCSSTNLNGVSALPSKWNIQKIQMGGGLFSPGKLFDARYWHSFDPYFSESGGDFSDFALDTSSYSENDFASSYFSGNGADISSAEFLLLALDSSLAFEDFVDFVWDLFDASPILQYIISFWEKDKFWFDNNKDSAWFYTLSHLFDHCIWIDDTATSKNRLLLVFDVLFIKEVFSYFTAPDIYSLESGDEFRNFIYISETVYFGVHYNYNDLHNDLHNDDLPLDGAEVSCFETSISEFFMWYWSILDSSIFYLPGLLVTEDEGINRPLFLDFYSQWMHLSIICDLAYYLEEKVIISDSTHFIKFIGSFWDFLVEIKGKYTMFLDFALTENPNDFIKDLKLTFKHFNKYYQEIERVLKEPSDVKKVSDSGAEVRSKAESSVVQDESDNVTGVEPILEQPTEGLSELSVTDSTIDLLTSEKSEEGESDTNKGPKILPIVKLLAAYSALDFDDINRAKKNDDIYEWRLLPRTDVVGEGDDPSLYFQFDSPRIYSKNLRILENSVNGLSPISNLLFQNFYRNLEYSHVFSNSLYETQYAYVYARIYYLSSIFYECGGLEILDIDGNSVSSDIIPNNCNDEFMLYYSADFSFEFYGVEHFLYNYKFLLYDFTFSSCIEQKNNFLFFPVKDEFPHPSRVYTFSLEDSLVFKLFSNLYLHHYVSKEAAVNKFSDNPYIQWNLLHFFSPNVSINFFSFSTFEVDLIFSEFSSFKSLVFSHFSLLASRGRPIFLDSSSSISSTLQDFFVSEERIFEVDTYSTSLISYDMSFDFSHFFIKKSSPKLSYFRDWKFSTRTSSLKVNYPKPRPGRYPSPLIKAFFKCFYYRPWSPHHYQLNNVLSDIPYIPEKNFILPMLKKPVFYRQWRLLKPRDAGYNFYNYFFIMYSVKNNLFKLFSLSDLAFDQIHFGVSLGDVLIAYFTTYQMCYTNTTYASYDIFNLDFFYLHVYNATYCREFYSSKPIAGFRKKYKAEISKDIKMNRIVSDIEESQSFYNIIELSRLTYGSEKTYLLESKIMWRLDNFLYDLSCFESYLRSSSDSSRDLKESGQYVLSCSSNVYGVLQSYFDSFFSNIKNQDVFLYTIFPSLIQFLKDLDYSPFRINFFTKSDDLSISLYISLFNSTINDSVFFSPFSFLYHFFGRVTSLFKKLMFKFRISFNRLEEFYYLNRNNAYSLFCDWNVEFLNLLERRWFFIIKSVWKNRYIIKNDKDVLRIFNSYAKQLLNRDLFMLRKFSYIHQSPKKLLLHLSFFLRETFQKSNIQWSNFFLNIQKNSSFSLQSQFLSVIANCEDLCKIGLSLVGKKETRGRKKKNKKHLLNKKSLKSSASCSKIDVIGNNSFLLQRTISRNVYRSTNCGFGLFSLLSSKKSVCRKNYQRDKYLFYVLSCHLGLYNFFINNKEVILNEISIPRFSTTWGKVKFLFSKKLIDFNDVSWTSFFYKLSFFVHKTSITNNNFKGVCYAFIDIFNKKNSFFGKLRENNQFMSIFILNIKKEISILSKVFSNLSFFTQHKIPEGSITNLPFTLLYTNKKQSFFSCLVGLYIFFYSLIISFVFFNSSVCNTKYFHSSFFFNSFLSFSQSMNFTFHRQTIIKSDFCSLANWVDIYKVFPLLSSFFSKPSIHVCSKKENVIPNNIFSKRGDGNLRGYDITTFWESGLEEFDKLKLTSVYFKEFWKIPFWRFNLFWPTTVGFSKKVYDSRMENMLGYIMKYYGIDDTYFWSFDIEYEQVQWIDHESMNYTEQSFCSSWVESFFTSSFLFFSTAKETLKQALLKKFSFIDKISSLNSSKKRSKQIFSILIFYFHVTAISSAYKTKINLPKYIIDNFSSNRKRIRKIISNNRSKQYATNSLLFRTYSFYFPYYFYSHNLRNKLSWTLFSNYNSFFSSNSFLYISANYISLLVNIYKDCTLIFEYVNIAVDGEYEIFDWNYIENFSVCTEKELFKMVYRNLFFIDIHSDTQKWSIDNKLFFIDIHDGMQNGSINKEGVTFKIGSESIICFLLLKIILLIIYSLLANELSESKKLVDRDSSFGEIADYGVPYKDNSRNGGFYNDDNNSDTEAELSSALLLIKRANEKIKKGGYLMGVTKLKKLVDKNFDRNWENLSFRNLDFLFSKLNILFVNVFQNEVQKSFINNFINNFSVHDGVRFEYENESPILDFSYFLDRNLLFIINYVNVPFLYIKGKEKRYSLPFKNSNSLISTFFSSFRENSYPFFFWSKLHINRSSVIRKNMFEKEVSFHKFSSNAKTFNLMGGSKELFNYNWVHNQWFEYQEGLLRCIEAVEADVASFEDGYSYLPARIKNTPFSFSSSLYFDFSEKMEEVKNNVETLFLTDIHFIYNCEDVFSSYGNDVFEFNNEHYNKSLYYNLMYYIKVELVGESAVDISENMLRKVAVMTAKFRGRIGIKRVRNRKKLGQFSFFFRDILDQFFSWARVVLLNEDGSEYEVFTCVEEEIHISYLNIICDNPFFLYSLQNENTIIRRNMERYKLSVVSEDYYLKFVPYFLLKFKFSNMVFSLSSFFWNIYKLFDFYSVTIFSSRRFSMWKRFLTKANTRINIVMRKGRVFWYEGYLGFVTVFGKFHFSFFREFVENRLFGKFRRRLKKDRLIILYFPFCIILYMRKPIIRNPYYTRVFIMNFWHFIKLVWAYFCVYFINQICLEQYEYVLFTVWTWVYFIYCIVLNIKFFDLVDNYFLFPVNFFNMYINNLKNIMKHVKYAKERRKKLSSYRLWWVRTDDTILKKRW